MTEHANLEYKRTYTKQALKTVSAFANHSGGVILFGVDDDGSPIGIDNIEQESLSIENAINDNIDPRPPYRLEKVLIEGCPIIRLTVDKGSNIPYLYDGRAYSRVNTSSIPMEAIELKRLLHSEIEAIIDSEPIEDNNFTFDILQKELKRAKGIEELTLDILRTLGLYTNSSYTRAAEWLADENNNMRCATSIVRFGENENVFLERRDINQKSLITQYFSAIDIYEKWYSEYEVVHGFVREERIRIPREAYREAVLNAMMHRRLDSNASVQIAMFPDYIEITSPGGLPFDVSKRDYLFGRVSNPRNPTICSVFLMINYIEKFGTGINRIRKSYQPYQMEPEFEISDNYITVRLPVIDYNLPSKGESLQDHMLRLFNEYRSLSRAELQTYTGYSASAVQIELRKMVADEIIRKIGTGRNTRYSIE